MARQEIKFDDVDFNADPPVHTEATVEVFLSYRGSSTMRLDLTDAHAKELDEIMAPWLALATEVNTPLRRNTRTPRADSDSDSPTVATLTPAEKKAYRTWVYDTTGQPAERYVRADGSAGGYKYPADLVAQWLAARETAKTAKADDDKADDKPSDDK
jgi:hypothetical protein